MSRVRVVPVRAAMLLFDAEQAGWTNEIAAD